MAGRSVWGPSRTAGQSPRSVLRARRGVAAVALLLLLTLGVSREARAFHPFRHGFGAVAFGHCGVGPIGWGGWCGPRFGGCAFGPGWGCGGPGFGGLGCWPAFGSVSYGTGFAFGGTRFWSGSTILGVPFWGGCAPVWGCPVWGAPVFAGSFCGGPVFGGPVWGVPAWRSPVSAWYGGWMAGPARGWNVGPARGWTIPFAAERPPRIGAVANRVRPAADAFAEMPGPERGGRAGVGAPVIDAAVETAIRTSNAPSRVRAARLVKAGDRHLRAAVDDPKQLAKAIDAYRRAVAIAADQPDTFLRQAIALTASGKREAAAAALARAVAIDGRLAVADGTRDAVLPLAVPAAVTALDVRSGKLVERIFAERGGAADANWIARRWADRSAAPVMVAAQR